VPGAAAAGDGKGPRRVARDPVPTPAIRNLIRDDKVHQIYGAMQTGQEKLGMQTANQSLASLYMKKLITLDVALGTRRTRTNCRK
jgi:twitching motility protein PilT